MKPTIERLNGLLEAYCYGMKYFNFIAYPMSEENKLRIINTDKSIFLTLERHFRTRRFTVVRYLNGASKELHHDISGLPIREMDIYLRGMVDGLTGGRI